MYRLRDIPEKEIHKLANVLQFRPRENHQDAEIRIKSDIKALPWRLRGPGRLIRFLCPTRIDTCQWHNGINRCVADVILHNIQLEVGFRLNNLVAHSKLLQGDQLDRIWRLRELHALWLEAEKFAETFRISPNWVKWDYQANNCDACILSRISGNLEILLDLRCMIKSRATSKYVAKYGDPPLLKWVMTWIETLLSSVEESTGQRLNITDQIEINDRRSVEFKRLRAKIHIKKKKEKAEAGHSEEEKDPDVQSSGHDLPDAFADQGEDVVASKKARSTHFPASEFHEHISDDALSAIDSYAALKSSLVLPMPTANDDDAQSARSRPNQQPRVDDDQGGTFSNPRAQWKKGASRIYPHAPTYMNPESTVVSKATAWDSVVFGSQYASGFDGNAHASGVDPRSGVPNKQTSSSHPASTTVDSNGSAVSSTGGQARKSKPSSNGGFELKSAGSGKPAPPSAAPSSTCYSSQPSSSRDARSDRTAATSTRSRSSYGPCYPPIRVQGGHTADSYLKLVDHSPFSTIREAPAFKDVSYDGRKDSHRTQLSSNSLSPTTKPSFKISHSKPLSAHRETSTNRRRQDSVALTEDFFKEFEQLERDLSPHGPSSSHRGIHHGRSQESVGTSILYPSSNTISPESVEALTPPGLRPERNGDTREQSRYKEQKASKQHQKSRQDSHSRNSEKSRHSAAPQPKASRSNDVHSRKNRDAASSSSTHRKGTPYGDMASSRMGSQATGWSDAYGAGLKEREDVQWYYGGK